MQQQASMLVVRLIIRPVVWFSGLWLTFYTPLSRSKIPLENGKTLVLYQMKAKRSVIISTTLSNQVLTQMGNG